MMANTKAEAFVGEQQLLLEACRLHCLLGAFNGEGVALSLNEAARLYIGAEQVEKGVGLGCKGCATPRGNSALASLFRCEPEAFLALQEAIACGETSFSAVVRVPRPPSPPPSPLAPSHPPSHAPSLTDGLPMLKSVGSAPTAASSTTFASFSAALASSVAIAAASVADAVAIPAVPEREPPNPFHNLTLQPVVGGCPGDDEGLQLPQQGLGAEGMQAAHTPNSSLPASPLVRALSETDHILAALEASRLGLDAHRQGDGERSADRATAPVLPCSARDASITAPGRLAEAPSHELSHAVRQHASAAFAGLSDLGHEDLGEGPGELDLLPVMERRRQDWAGPQPSTGEAPDGDANDRTSRSDAPLPSLAAYHNLQGHQQQQHHFHHPGSARNGSTTPGSSPCTSAGGATPTKAHRHSVCNAEEDAWASSSPGSPGRPQRPRRATIRDRLHRMLSSLDLTASGSGKRGSGGGQRWMDGGPVSRCASQAEMPTAFRMSDVGRGPRAVTRWGSGLLQPPSSAAAAGAAAGGSDAAVAAGHQREAAGGAAESANADATAMGCRSHSRQVNGPASPPAAAAAVAAPAAAPPRVLLSIPAAAAAADVVAPASAHPADVHAPPPSSGAPGALEPANSADRPFAYNWTPLHPAPAPAPAPGPEAGAGPDGRVLASLGSVGATGLRGSPWIEPYGSGDLPSPSTHGSFRTSFRTVDAIDSARWRDGDARPPLHPLAEEGAPVAWLQVNITIRRGAALPGAGPQAAMDGGGQLLLLLNATDVSSWVESQQRLEGLLQEEHKLLEAMFPRHVIEHVVRNALSASASNPASADGIPIPNPISPSLPLPLPLPAAASSPPPSSSNLVPPENHSLTTIPSWPLPSPAGTSSASGDPAKSALRAAPGGGSVSVPSVTRGGRIRQRALATPHLARFLCDNGSGSGSGSGSGGGGAGATPLPLATAHKHVTVLFADIVGFTTMCNCLEPLQVMAFLNGLFTRFDSLCDIYGVYKVETIGDCFMVVGGLIALDAEGFKAVRPDGAEDELHAVKVMSFAKAMQREVCGMTMPHNGQPLRLRVGLHSGPVTAGIVGSKMPRFCLFGDTVNTASRMESTCEPGAIHASAATAALLPDEAWAPTGGVQVKGKGEMQTYTWRPPLPPVDGGAPTAVAVCGSLRRNSTRALLGAALPVEREPKEHKGHMERSSGAPRGPVALKELDAIASTASAPLPLAARQAMGRGAAPPPPPPPSAPLPSALAAGRGAEGCAGGA